MTTIIPAVEADLERLEPIRFTNSAEIRLFASNDDITLEYDDRVLLSFSPANPALIPSVEATGEYIRDSATVNIIDNDSKIILTMHICHLLLLCRARNKFYRA